MRKHFILAALALILSTALFTAAAADNAVDPQHTWDLTDLYPTTADWDRAREEVLAELESIEARKGTLGDSADSLYQASAGCSSTRHSMPMKTCRSPRRRNAGSWHPSHFRGSTRQLRGCSPN
jgi:hypothetical protein